MKLIKSSESSSATANQRVVALSNDADPMALERQLSATDRVDLFFPKFTDGRAFSQAWLLRRRLRFAGEIRATGDVLIDQLQQMQRSGFSEAVLREDQDASHGARLLEGFGGGFYQGDIANPRPRFAA
jgi:uncharacterized protein (DUF934 family)